MYSALIVLKDLYGFQLKEDGSALIMIYDSEMFDLSGVVDGGKKEARVAGAIVQEIDPQGNVVFEWRSWDGYTWQFRVTKKSLDTFRKDRREGEIVRSTGGVIEGDASDWVRPPTTQSSSSTLQSARRRG
ncbi:unnamed protein product [Vitrella brassicaformis CCMP3155]|uniref:Uncharacterized protein n=1 Tax=Vitrella brassicaformis (strain CCMP3155) TaxID=1169540 RepID=A0A0G4H843_VITBC|nr:unnamed protein product [Vitrella brassicaformis CCMP3155]|eukprot:CEM39977.1 unnamed protein product [Vitrella brassicaformis CCMP3155]